MCYLKARWTWIHEFMNWYIFSLYCECGQNYKVFSITILPWAWSLVIELHIPLLTMALDKFKSSWLQHDDFFFSFFAVKGIVNFIFIILKITNFIVVSLRYPCRKLFLFFIFIIQFFCCFVNKYCCIWFNIISNFIFICKNG